MKDRLFASIRETHRPRPLRFGGLHPDFESLEPRLVPTAFTMLSPTGPGALPAGITPVGGIVVDLVGLNGRRVVSQLPASSLFIGLFDGGTPADFRGNPGTIGVQSGWSSSVLDQLGGGLREMALRLTVYDGDTGLGDFDAHQNFLILDGLQMGDFSDVATEETGSDGVTIISENPSGGFRNNALDTGFFYSSDRTFLSGLYDSLLSTGVLRVQLRDVDPYDNTFDFTQGVDGGLKDVGTSPIIVNVPPRILSTGGDTFVRAGSAVTISVTAIDPDAFPGQSLAYQFDFDGDGTYEVSSASGTVTHTFDTPGTQTVHVRVVDVDGGSAEGTITLNVVAPPPEVRPAPRQSVDEGTSTFINLGGFSDIVPGVNWGVMVNWGDGSPDESFNVSSTGDLGNLAHAFAVPGNYNVHVRVTNAQGLTDSAGFQVDVANVAPSLIPPESGNSVEGTQASFSLGYFSDPGSDGAWLVSVNWGDGSTQTTFQASNPGELIHQTHRYLRAGTYPVTVRVADAFGGTDAGTFPVAVQNVAPSYTPPEGSGVDEGTTASFSLGRFTDPGDDSPWTIMVDWGDGSAAQSFQMYSSGAITSQPHRFARYGSYEVRVRVSDGFGGSDEGTFPVEVRNVAPILSVPARADASEGTSTSFSLGDFVDPGADGPWQVSVDWGDGSVTERFSASTPGDLGNLTHEYRQDGAYALNVKVDDGRDSVLKVIPVTVKNLPPSFQVLNQPPRVLAGGSLTLGLLISDAGALDRHRLTADANGNSTSVTRLGVGEYLANMTLSAPGNSNTMDVSLSLLDDGGGFASQTVSIPVVFPPAPIAKASVSGVQPMGPLPYATSASVSVAMTLPAKSNASASSSGPPSGPSTFQPVAPVPSSGPIPVTPPANEEGRQDGPPPAFVSASSAPGVNAAAPKASPARAIQIAAAAAQQTATAPVSSGGPGSAASTTSPPAIASSASASASAETAEVEGPRTGRASGAVGTALIVLATLQNQRSRMSSRSRFSYAYRRRKQSMK